MNCYNLKIFYVTIVTKKKKTIKYTQKEMRKKVKHVTKKRKSMKYKRRQQGRKDEKARRHIENN